MADDQEEDGLNEPARGRPRSLAKTAAIVDAARDLFLEHGFEQVSVDAIAERAGVSKATIYGHFPGKQELFDAVVQGRSARLTPMVEALIAGADGDRPVREILVEFGTLLASTVLPARERAWERDVVAESKRRPELARSLFRAGPARIVGLLASLLETRTANGELAIAEPEFAAEQFIGLLFGLEMVRGLMASQPRRTRAHWRARAEGAADTFLARFGAASPGDEAGES